MHQQLGQGVIWKHSNQILCPRMHHYEGYSYEEVAYAVRVMRLLGAKTLIVTNAAGCVNTSWNPGDLMLITDHIKIFMICAN